jgi:hypothetical protein
VSTTQKNKTSKEKKKSQTKKYVLTRWQSFGQLLNFVLIVNNQRIQVFAYKRERGKANDERCGAAVRMTQNETNDSRATKSQHAKRKNDKRTAAQLELGLLGFALLGLDLADFDPYTIGRSARGVCAALDVQRRAQPRRRRATFARATTTTEARAAPTLSSDLHFTSLRRDNARKFFVSKICFG